MKNSKVYKRAIEFVAWRRKKPARGASATRYGDEDEKGDGDEDEE